MKQGASGQPPRTLVVGVVEADVELRSQDLYLVPAEGMAVMTGGAEAGCHLLHPVMDRLRRRIVEHWIAGNGTTYISGLETHGPCSSLAGTSCKKRSVRRTKVEKDMSLWVSSML